MFLLLNKLRLAQKSVFVLLSCVGHCPDDKGQNDSANNLVL